MDNIDNKKDNLNVEKPNRLDIFPKEMLDGILKKKQAGLLWVQGKKDEKLTKFSIDKDIEVFEVNLTSALKLVSEKEIKLDGIKVGDPVSLVFFVDEKTKDKKAITIKHILVDPK